MIQYNAVVTLETSGLTSGQIDQTVNAMMAKLFPPFALGLVEDSLQANPGKEYSLSVDRRVASSLSDIQRARQEVLLVYLRASVELAIGEFARILAEAYQQRASEWPYRNTLLRQTPVNVAVFYGGDKKATRRVSNYAEIKNFEAGDYVMLTSENPWQMYLNTRGKARNSLRVKPPKKDIPNFKGGFFGYAAKRIRTVLNIRQKGANPLWVGAVRSIAVLAHLGPPTGLKSAGYRNWLQLYGLGAWAIKIRFSKRMVASGGGLIGG